jgi:Flp pilus assembly secretin CpaC
VRLVSLAEGVFERVRSDIGARNEKYEPTGDAPLTVTYLNDKQTFKFIEAVQADQRTNVMQAPKLTMFNGQMATINVTEQQTFVTGVDVRWNGDHVMAVPRQETFPVGFKMTVQPVAAADQRSVKLSLNAGLTELEGSKIPLSPVTTMLNTVGGRTPESVPFTQYIQMPRVAQVISCDKTLQIPEGTMTVLRGDWKRLREVRTEYGPPVLSQVPYVNRLFKNVGYGRDCEEVMLMVRPRIVINEQEEVRQVGCEAPAEKPRVVEDAVIRAAVVVPPSGEPPLAVAKEAGALPKKSLRTLNPKTAESPAAALVKKKVARIMEKYHRACAEGRLEEARELASKALALDPACFSKDR